MAQSNLKILFLGVGAHCQQSHIKHLKDIAGVWGIYDPNKENVEKAIREYQLETAQVFDDELEAMQAADAVLIASPDRFHFSQLQKAVEQGCHVFCEKPMASSLEDAQELKKVFARAKEKGLTVTTCHPRRFDPPYLQVKEKLPELIQEFGKVMEVHLDFTYHKPSKIGLHGGSMLQDHANHEIDYVCWLFGTDVGFKAYKLWDEEDRYALTGIREDGVVFNFSGTRRLNEKVYPETIQVRFERGELYVDTKDAKNSYVLVHGTREKRPVDIDATDYDVRFGDMNNHWLKLIAGEEEGYVSENQMLLNTEMSVVFQDKDSFTYRP